MFTSAAVSRDFVDLSLRLYCLIQCISFVYLTILNTPLRSIDMVQWSLDFVSPTDGRRTRAATVIAAFSPRQRLPEKGFR